MKADLKVGLYVGQPLPERPPLRWPVP